MKKPPNSNPIARVSSKLQNKIVADKREEEIEKQRIKEILEGWSGNKNEN